MKHWQDGTDGSDGSGADPDVLKETEAGSGFEEHLEGDRAAPGGLELK